MLLPLTVTWVVPEKGPLNRCACMRACVVKQSYAFSALTLLVGLQEEHLAGKNWVTTCWCGCLSGCWLFAYGPADATASQNPIISCVIKIRTGFTLWYQLTQVVLEKRPFNGCSSSCCYYQVFGGQIHGIQSRCLEVNCSMWFNWPHPFSRQCLIVILFLCFCLYFFVSFSH